MKQLHKNVALTLGVFASWMAPTHANVVTEWNALAVQCINRPGAGAALDLALVQAAVHDAIQAIEHRYAPYFAAPPTNGNESRAAAAAAAARRVLGTVCPSTAQPALDVALESYVTGNDPGLAIGYAAGDALLTKLRPTPALPPVHRRYRSGRMAADTARQRADAGFLSRDHRTVRDVEPVAVPPRPAAGTRQQPVFA
jgi:hypothetical protein